MQKTSNPYLKLNIDREKLLDAIMEFFLSKGNGYEVADIFESKGADRQRLHFKVEGSTSYLDFRFNNDGTTTIDINTGPYSNFRNELADFIKKSNICTTPEIVDFDKSYFTFPGIELTDFEDTLHMVLAENNTLCPIPQTLQFGKQWKILKTTGEKLTVSYFFKSKKALLQGKPLKIFMDLHTHLITLFEPSDIPKLFEENRIVVTSSIEKNDIINEFDTHFPNSSSSLSETLKKFLYQALYNTKITTVPFESSQLAFPALKALEGHLKYVMHDKRIALEDKRFTMFAKDTQGNYHIHDLNYQSKFTPSQLTAINQAYRYYNANRHSIFHYEDVHPVDLTRIIDNPVDAHRIIKSIFRIIDSYYL
ncbi:RNase LS family HEPN domain-containing protein [Solibacillus cecembensis]|uniref:RNase LS family HEPN domain-containing protein n=1 Tax=Solibacillus cecembensis TaxID=459347 RepID=UPI003D047CD5